MSMCSIGVSIMFWCRDPALVLTVRAFSDQREVENKLFGQTPHLLQHTFADMLVIPVNSAGNQRFGG